MLVPRLILRGRKEKQWGTSQSSLDLAFEQNDPLIRELTEDIEATNSFLVMQRIEGVSFPGLRRIFNDGDVPGKAWRRGGRYYSLPGGDRYESWSGIERKERITINQERVAEADIRASHLTLLHALTCQSLETDSDPYVIEGVDRGVVKFWINQALGTSRIGAKRWSQKAKQEYAELHLGKSLKDDFPILAVQEAILKRYPLMARISELGISTLDLQYHESEILRIAMRKLRENKGIPSLPIHDGLILPRSALREAEMAILLGWSIHIAKTTGKTPSAVPRITLK